MEIKKLNKNWFLKKIGKFIHKNSLNDNVCAQNPLYS